MTQISLHWDGASLGDADALTVNAADGIGYRLANEDYESPFIDRMMRAVLNGTGNRGVLNNWLNELAVAGVATPVTVATGAAIIYGLYYENDASLNVVVTSPTSDTRYDRIVIRRDWSAQTARVTHLEGVEGAGYAPAITQSVAPGGTGIYDIPLASFSVTTGGVIAVTDEREYCQFTLEPQDDAFGTTELVNEGADNASRATRTKTLFLGGGDAEPATIGDRFQYNASGSSILTNAISTWGSALATEEGWQAVANDTSFYHAFKVPHDWAGGDITATVWWMDDAGAALAFYIRSTYQRYASATDVVYGEGNTNTYINNTYAVGQVETAAARTISSPLAGEMIYYWIQFDLLAGAEDVLYLGLELNYTGYL
jgi:hypothetical protein